MKLNEDLVIPIILRKLKVYEVEYIRGETFSFKKLVTNLMRIGDQRGVRIKLNYKIALFFEIE